MTRMRRFSILFAHGAVVVNAAAHATKYIEQHVR
jgi:hypothetical protein